MECICPLFPVPSPKEFKILEKINRVKIVKQIWSLAIFKSDLGEERSSKILVHCFYYQCPIFFKIRLSHLDNTRAH